MIKWAERIKLAETNEKFLKDDIEMSQLWTTDPISEYYGIVEFKDNNIKRGPKDIYLILDGIFFTKALEEQDLNLARACYDSIEKRVKKIKKV